MYLFLVLGKVYNLTYYMKFHLGSREELMRGAGIDSTILFDQVSCIGTAWVSASINFNMVQECVCYCYWKLFVMVCCWLLVLDKGA